MEFANRPTRRRNWRQFIKLGHSYVRPENIIALMPYKGLDTMTRVVLSSGAEYTIDMSCEEVVRIIEGDKE